MSTRINYDLIASEYDGDAYRMKPVDQRLIDFLQSRKSEDHEGIRVLDLGCGTGNQILSNKNQFPTLQYTGVDYSVGMLEQARRKSADVEWIHGDAQNLPFSDATFDYVSSQFHYHHVENKQRMFEEIYRSLKPGGWFVLTNACPEEMLDWPVYRFFPGTLARDQKDFLTPEQLRSLLVSVGFLIREQSLQVREISEATCDHLEAARRKTSCSQLVALSDADWQRGLKELEQALSVQDQVIYHLAELNWVMEK